MSFSDQSAVEASASTLVWSDTAQRELPLEVEAEFILQLGLDPTSTEDTRLFGSVFWQGAIIFRIEPHSSSGSARVTMILGQSRLAGGEEIPVEDLFALVQGARISGGDAARESLRNLSQRGMPFAFVMACPSTAEILECITTPEAALASQGEVEVRRSPQAPTRQEEMWGEIMIEADLGEGHSASATLDCVPLLAH
jgi:hypothetical protein